MEAAKPRSALVIIGELANGLVNEELTNEIAKAYAAAMATGRPATVTLKLVVKPLQGPTQGINPDMLTIIAETSTKLPKPPSDPTIFFVNRDGNISRNQDRQAELGGIREVNAGAVAPSSSPQAAG